MLSYNDGMTKRIRWFIALAVALIGACVAMWQWSARPPYRFLAEAQLWTIHSGSPDYWFYYTSPKNATEIIESANLETGANSWKRMGRSEKWQYKPTFSHPAGFIVRIYRDAKGHMISSDQGFPAPDPQARTMIVLWRAPTFHDRVQAWLWGIRSEPKTR